MANNYCQSLQSKLLNLNKTNTSTDLIFLAQKVQGGSCPQPPPPPSPEWWLCCCFCSEEDYLVQTVFSLFTVNAPCHKRPACQKCSYTAIWRKAVGKSTRDNPERYCGWLWGHCSSKKFERMIREATDICLWVLKKSNKSRFDSFSHYEQCIDHIPHYLSGLLKAHFFWQPFSKQLYILATLLLFTNLQTVHTKDLDDAWAGCKAGYRIPDHSKSWTVVMWL